MDKNKCIIRAQRFALRGSIDKAINEYKRALEVDPGDIIVRLRLGDLFAKKGNKEDAIREYLEVAERNAESGFTLKAIAVYKQILKLKEDMADIQFKLAELYMKQGLMVDAMHHFSFALKSYEKKGDSREAILLLKRLVAIEPENIPIRIRLAKEEYHAGNVEEALKVVNETSQRLVEKGAWDKLEKFYKRLLNDGLKDERIYRGLINLYSLRNEKNALLNVYKKLLDLVKREGIKEKIEEVCKGIIKISPQDPDAVNTLGTISQEGIKGDVRLVKEGQTPLSGESDKGISNVIKPESVSIKGEEYKEEWFNETELLKAVEEVEDFEKHYNMGIVYMEMELFDDALREFSISSKDKRFRFDSYNRSGLCLVAMGRPLEACKYFERGLNLPDRTEGEYKGLTYELALACEASGRLEKALELFKKVEDKDKDFRDVKKKIIDIIEKINRGDISARRPIPTPPEGSNNM